MQDGLSDCDTHRAALSVLVYKWGAALKFPPPQPSLNFANQMENTMKSIDYFLALLRTKTLTPFKLNLRRRALLIAIALVGASVMAPLSDTYAESRQGNKYWVGTWTASPQAPEPPFVPAIPAQFDNQTIRQIVHTSIGGRTVRVRLSNEYGSGPLKIGAAHIALQATGSSIVSGSSRPLTFSGQTSIVIPSAAPVLSDPIDFDVPPLSNLAVSIHLPNVTPVKTFHSLGVQTTYISNAGNFVGETSFPTASTTTSGYFLTGVTVAVSKRNAAIVTLGDSITDGYASTVDANHRWPNILAERLQSRRELKHLAVLNHGISGNRTLNDIIGPNALARFDRDVLNAPGVKYIILLEGINNIGLPGAFGLADQQVSADEIIAGHRQLIARAHEKRLKIYGGTLTPFEGTTFPGYFSAEGEVKRQTVNAWIRSSGEFDAVIDFDKIIQDPARPIRMLPAYDSGDHLHPNDAGYKAMADAVNLSLFRDEDD